MAAGVWEATGASILTMTTFRNADPVKNAGLAWIAEKKPAFPDPPNRNEADSLRKVSISLHLMVSRFVVDQARPVRCCLKNDFLRMNKPPSRRI